MIEQRGAAATSLASRARWPEAEDGAPAIALEAKRRARATQLCVVRGTVSGSEG